MKLSPSAQSTEKDTSSSLKYLLSVNPEYSKVFSLIDFVSALTNNNQSYKQNKEEIFKLIKAQSFYSFLSKGIICFPSMPFSSSYENLISQIRSAEALVINSNYTLINILCESIRYLGQDSSYVQISNPNQFRLSDNQHQILKNFSNRLINSRNFELLRLCIGDVALFYIFKYSSLFVFDELAINYIQVLGPSLKDTMRRLLDVPIANENINKKNIFQKVYSCNSSQLLLEYKEKDRTRYIKQSYNKEKEKRLPDNRIPHNHSFEVERTKIYYCPFFNRKLGFLQKKNLFCVDKINRDFGMRTYDSLFWNISEIIPDNIKKCIVKHMNTIGTNLLKINYPQMLFRFCPIISNWQTIKKEAMLKINKLNNSTTEDRTKENLNSELMETLKQLINSNISFEQLNKFVCCFISSIIPQSFLGKHNLSIIKKKISLFISMNRFETLNRINLFEQKEFSFTQMKWLNFKMSNKAYSEIGILLKNFLMKSIIFFIFDFILVQLFRSHFFVTEKQGDHFKSFYYHKTLYDLIIKICFAKYIHIAKQYKTIEKKEAIDTLTSISSTLGKLRLMPKPSTMRPITSFKKKTRDKNKGINNKTKNDLKMRLFDTQKIFKLIQNKMQKNQENCVVFDYKEILKRLMNLKLKLKSNEVNSNMKLNPQLVKYLSYVTLDIEACYDNIDIKLLNYFLDNDHTISPTYVTGVLYVIMPKPKVLKEKVIHFKECFDVKLIYIVCDLNEYIHVLNFIQKREEMTYKNCIVYLDNNGMSFKNKIQFMPFVRDIINNNIIKFNHSFLKQIKGIPQGLSISSFLCNLFFYEIERGISNELQKDYAYNNNILLRFMDDYLCLASEETKVTLFKSTAVNLSKINRFNFNLKKSQTNLIERGGITQLNSNNKPLFNEEKTKFTWNGIYFELGTNCTFFNLIYEAKLSDDINEYSKLINVKLPVIDNYQDYSWLKKKINSILFSGHPWIYFLSTINEETVLQNNFECYLRFITLKLLVLFHQIQGTQLLPSQSNIIGTLDLCLLKMYSFFDTKIYEIEVKHFFIPYAKFFSTVYVTIFKNFFVDDNNYNSKMIHYSPSLFLAIKRKIERLKGIKTVSKGTKVFNDIKRELEELLEEEIAFE